MIRAAVIAFCLTAIAARADQSFQSISIAPDANVVLIDSTGVNVAPPVLENQVSVSHLLLSPDRHIAGWLVEEENGGTAYPVATSLVLFRNGHVFQRLGDGLMVYKWAFRNGSLQVVLETGTVHGMQGRHMLLFSVETGRQLKEWSGEDGQSPPEWGRALK